MARLFEGTFLGGSYGEEWSNGDGYSCHSSFDPMADQGNDAPCHGTPTRATNRGRSSRGFSNRGVGSLRDQTGPAVRPQVASVMGGKPAGGSKENPEIVRAEGPVKAPVGDLTLSNLTAYRPRPLPIQRGRYAGPSSSPVATRSSSAGDSPYSLIDHRSQSRSPRSVTDSPAAWGRYMNWTM
jgi:hypothetical protein